MKLYSIFLCSTLIFYTVSCEKSSKIANDDFLIPKNSDVTITKPNGLSVHVSDVFSKRTEFRRKITITPSNTSGNLSDIYVTFISSDGDNIYDKMKTNPTGVNGRLIIETEGQIILTKQVVNGKWGSTKLEKRNAAISRVVSVACTVKTIHDCVAWEIEDMNWIEYGACLVSAPACYATLWASCTWEVCHNHKTYVNPNN